MPETRDGRAYKRYTVELHPDVDARFRAFVDSLGRSKADVVREAIEAYIDERSPAGTRSSIASRSA